MNIFCHSVQNAFTLDVLCNFFFLIEVCVCVCSVMSDSLQPIACSLPDSSVEFFRQEYCTELPFPTTRYLSYLKMNPCPLWVLKTSATWEALIEQCSESKSDFLVEMGRSWWEGKQRAQSAVRETCLHLVYSFIFQYTKLNFILHSHWKSEN